MYIEYDLILLGMAITGPIAILINLILKKSMRIHIFTLIILGYTLGILSVAFWPIMIDPMEAELYKQGWRPYSVNLIPFKSISDALDHFYYMVAVRNIVGNLLLLFPLGIIVGLFARKQRILLLSGLICSVSIELLQLILSQLYLIRPRTIDIDDVLLNTLGYFIGYFCYRLIQRLWPWKAKVITYEAN